MSEQRVSSYDISEMPTGVDRELQRLRQQALVTWEKEARDLRWWGLTEGMSVLELGSGPGLITERLVRLAPQLKVTALEVDSVLIQKAKDYLRGSGGSWEIVQGNVMQMDFPDNSFDFAYGRYLFQHLPDPVGAAREVRRVLKPGGKLVIADVDDQLNIFDPPATGEAEVIHQKVGAARKEEQESKGGNRLAGRSLLRILRDAGFESLDLEAVLMHNRLVDLSDVAPKPDPGRLDRLVKEGNLTQDEVEVVIADVEEFEASDPVIILTLLLACGEKPATG